MSVLSLALVAAHANLSVPAGTYRLSELATTLNKQGVEVAVNRDCAEDVFAARLENIAWGDLSAALVKTGRLQVTPKGSGWIVARSPEAAESEKRALARYLGAAAREVETTYAPLVAELIELDAMSERERDARQDLLSRNREESEATRLLADLAYLHSSNELRVEDLILPLALARMTGGAPLGRLVTTDLESLRDVFNRDGKWWYLEGPYRILTQTMPTADELYRISRNGKVTVKMPFDPLTLRKSVSFRIWWERDPVTISIPDRPVYSVLDVPSLRNSDVWTAKELVDQADRVARTRTVVGPAASSPTLSLDGRPLRVSEAMLRVATGSGANLLHPVAAYTDDVVELSGPQSLGSVLIAGERPGVGSWYRARSRERTAVFGGGSSGVALRPALRRTADRSGSILVVRDERQFLDRFCPTSAALPSALENTALADRAPSLTDLAAHVAAIKISAWPRSTFASGYLRFCNPATFRPFAKAIAASAPFRARLASLPIYVLAKPREEGESKMNDNAWEIPFGRLDSKVQSAIRLGVAEAAEHNDTGDGSWSFLDPRSAPLIFERIKDEPRLRVLRRSERRLEFQILLDYGVAWQSWVENVDLR